VREKDWEGSCSTRNRTTTKKAMMSTMREAEVHDGRRRLASTSIKQVVEGAVWYLDLEDSLGRERTIGGGEN